MSMDQEFGTSRNLESGVSGNLDSGVWRLGAGVWSVGSGVWGLGCDRSVAHRGKTLSAPLGVAYAPTSSTHAILF